MSNRDENAKEYIYSEKVSEGAPSSRLSKVHRRPAISVEALRGLARIIAKKAIEDGVIISRKEHDEIA